jgi:tetratricopeptide (TPR) repeat protein
MGAICTRSNRALPVNTQVVSTVSEDPIIFTPPASTAPLVPAELNENLEDFTVIWLDAGIDTSSDCADTKQHLQSIINYLKTFTNAVLCVDYIKAVKEEKVFLIVSGAYGEHIVPQIENLPQIHVIYVFCQDEKRHERWVSNHPIVHGLFTGKQELYKKLIEDVQSADASLLSIMVLSPDSKENQVTDLSKQSAKYLWSQMLIETLLRFPSSKKAKNDMLKECRQQYYDNKSQLAIIQEFDDNYLAENAIWWYTRECFLYKVVNKALRTDNIDVIFNFRFFIKDLYNQLSEMHAMFIKSSPTIIHIYRGQYMSMKELKKIEENINGHISMNTFLSASTTMETALAFVTKNPRCTDLVVVLFQIEMDSTIATKPFASIKSKSFFQEENEILLAMGSTFSINKVEQDEQGIWNVTLVWVNKEDVELLTYMKKSLSQSTNLETLGSILIDMGELVKAERYFKLLLEQLPANHPSIGNIYLQMSTIGLNQSNLQKAIEYLEKAEKIFQMSHPTDHPCYGSLYFNMGRIQLLQCDFISAQLNFEKAAEIFLKTAPSNDLKLADVYVLSGALFSITGESSIALTQLKKGLEIQLAHLPACHPDIARFI